MEGLVIKNTGSLYVVRTKEGTDYECKIKGKFRIQNIRTTNPIAVGDEVIFTKPDSEPIAYITEIKERRNYIIRRSSNLSKETHILAANLDQAFLFITINYPETNLVFIDRFLTTAEAYHIPVILVFNKIDCYNEEETEYLDNVIHLYETIGYKCYKISAKNNIGLDPLIEALKDKKTLLSGNSGVGKSTFIQAVNPNFKVKTGEISMVHNKGMHTTTFSEMYILDNGGYLIDTPGIKGFGIIDISKEELSHYFPEIFKFSKDCKFNNCTHIHEPGCAVKTAVENQEISQSRYFSYINILEDTDLGKYR